MCTYWIPFSEEHALEFVWYYCISKNKQFPIASSHEQHHLVCLLCLSCRKSVHHKIFCGTIRLVHICLFQCAFVDVRHSVRLCGQMDYLEWPSNYVVCMSSPSWSRLVCFCMKDDGTISNLFCSSLSMGGLRGMDWLHAAVSISPMSKLGAQWKEVLEYPSIGQHLTLLVTKRGNRSRGQTGLLLEY
jgi:hypothetical protein